MRLPFIPWSIAGVSLSQALLGRLITAPPSVSSLSDHDHCGGTLPPRSWARGGETYHWCATAPTLFVFVLAAACTMLCQDLTPGLAPTQHPCVQPHFTPTSSPPTPLHLIAISIFGYKRPVRHVPLCLASVAAKDRATIHINSTHSINTCKHPTPTRFGKVYKRALVVPPVSPYQRAFVCGSCTGTTQVGISLVSLFDPLFKRFRLHCLNVCLT